MSKKSLPEVISTFGIYKRWLARYIENIPLFIEEAAKGQSWDEWNQDILFNYLFLNKGHCAGSLGQGNFTNNERKKIQKNWERLKLLLADIANKQDTFNLEEYRQIERVMRAFTERNTRVATRRMIAALQPEVLCTIYNENSLNRLIKYLKDNVVNAEQINDEGDWFQKSHEIFKFFESNVDVSSLDLPNFDGVRLPPNTLDKMVLMTLPWQVYELSLNNKQPLLITTQMDNPMNAAILAILENHNPQIILQGPPGTGKTYTAKDVAEELIFDSVSLDKKEQKDRLEKSDQFELIQFHPSYAYEDFVQKIAVGIDDQSGQLIYSVESSILMEFADKALKNYLASKKDQKEVDKELVFDQQFDNYVSFLTQELGEREKIEIPNSVRVIVNVVKDAIIVRGETGKETRVLFNDIKGAYLAGNITFSDIKNNRSLSGTAPHIATYIERILTMFRNSEFIESNISLTEKIEKKPYVLIIDEINRSNLAVVLGELIYALEYRGESVKPLYGKKEDNNHQLILPPNLYIIGTMNTADRSAMSMDYAIRRRFAFFNMLPQELDLEDFNKDIFLKVSKLFIQDTDEIHKEVGQKLERSEYLSEEFKPEDVWIGHSYFIGDEAEMEYKITYEIIPLIEEYIKDGILKESAYEVLPTLIAQDD